MGSCAGDEKLITVPPLASPPYPVAPPPPSPPAAARCGSDAAARDRAPSYGSRSSPDPPALGRGASPAGDRACASARGHVLAADRLLLHLEAMPSQRLMQQRRDVAAVQEHLAWCRRLGPGGRMAHQLQRQRPQRHCDHTASADRALVDLQGAVGSQGPSVSKRAPGVNDSAAKDCSHPAVWPPCLPPPRRRCAATY